MTDIPTLHAPLQLPSDKQHGIGAAVKHALMFAPSMTDIMIHEGQVIRAKSARGTLPLHQLFTAIPPFVVTREHIVTYLAGYVDGQARQHRDDRGQHQTVQQYWDTRIKPVLARQRSVNIRLDGRGGHSLRYSLFMDVLFNAWGASRRTRRATPSGWTAPSAMRTCRARSSTQRP